MPKMHLAVIRNIRLCKPMSHSLSYRIADRLHMRFGDTCDAVGEGLSSEHSALRACTRRRGMLSAASNRHRWFRGKGPCSCRRCHVHAIPVCVRQLLSASLSSVSAANTGIPCRQTSRLSARQPLYEGILDAARSWHRWFRGKGPLQL